MINPVNRARTPEGMATYKVEPYVVAADVYALAPHAGRGGWTWYTGSAGWMYRLVVESLLGLAREGDRLRFEPCLPANWAGFTLRYRFGSTLYEIAVQQLRAGSGESRGATTVTADGAMQHDNSIQLVDDQTRHRVVVAVAL